MKSSTYIDQDGCWNCQHVHMKSEWDEGCQYFCKFYSQPPTLQKDYDADGRFNEAIFENNLAIWEDWKENRDVNPWGKCENYKKSS